MKTEKKLASRPDISYQVAFMPRSRVLKISPVLDQFPF